MKFHLNKYRWYWIIRRDLLEFWDAWNKHKFFSKFLPHIHRRLPQPPKECDYCIDWNDPDIEPSISLVAFDTGEGFGFDWVCNNCQEHQYAEIDWWPNWFGVWTTAKELKQMGVIIE